MLAQKLLSGGGVEPLYVDDVFSAYTYTGNGSTQTINNGIDLAGKGGLVWIKARTSTNNHELVDTIRGATKRLYSNLTNAEDVHGSLTSFSSTGFALGSSGGGNANTATYVSWTFRKAPKFFDVVTYTGDGTSNRQIPHNLGVAPGMVIVKATSTTSHWMVYHRLNGNFSGYGSPERNYLLLNQTNSTGEYLAAWGSTAPTASNFTVGAVDAGLPELRNNASGVSYVAYLFAHDPSADGIIQCGSFTTDGSGNATVNLGWEPQYLMFKGAGHATDWYTYDQMRGFNVSGNARLFANTAAAEDASGILIKPSSTGFTDAGNTFLGASKTYIYLAIRRPNKPPTSGTQVYNAIALSGDSTTNRKLSGVGFNPDLMLFIRRGTGDGSAFHDKLRGVSRQLLANDTVAEMDKNPSPINSFDMDGATVSFGSLGVNINATAQTYINHFFRRAPGVFDVVCYTGTGVARTVNHSLGVAPELMIVKVRSHADDWVVYSAPTGNTSAFFMNTTGAVITGLPTFWNSTTPTSTAFSVANETRVNGSARTHVAYLFATLPGISKVGSYTGNGGAADSAGSSQTINCGFTTGSRFVMLKCTSHTSDWIIVDTVRGLVAGNDPTLSLNTTAAEVTGQDLLDPDASGFVVNQLGSGANTSANFNVTGRTYLVLSIS